MSTLIVSFLVACVTQNASAHLETSPKSFAVFVVSYNTTDNEVRGGVAGTAFFLSPGKAVTAYHVLQEKSFEPQPGFERVRVWLVHEGERAVELQPSDLKFRADRDLTEITLDSSRFVNARFVYATEKNIPAQGEVHSEGFIASTAGPVLARNGEDLEIVAVPRLERLSTRGHLLRRAAIDLRATDVTLVNVPCFEVSYRPVKGLSGGPLLVNGRVVGMNSFADPVSRSRTWAVAL